MSKSLFYIFNKIENLKISLGSFLLAFLAIAFARMMLEGFSDPGFQGPFMGWTTIFLHMPLWFAMAFVYLLILLKILTKSPVEKIAKVQLLFFPVVLFPPLFDLIITSGVGRFLSYIFVSNIKELGTYFATFFWRPEISLGIRIEGVIVLLTIAAYVFSKTKKISATFTGVFLAFAILFVLGSFPSFPVIFQSRLENLNPSLFYQFLTVKKQSLLIGQNYIHPSQSLAEQAKNFFDLLISAQIFIGLTVGLIIVFFLWNKDKFLAFLKNIRPLRLLHYWLMFFIGIVIAYSLFGSLPQFHAYNLLSLILMLTVIALLWLAAILENDIYDLEADKLSNPDRPLVKNELTIAEAKRFRLIVFLLSIIGSLILGYQVFIFILFAHIVAFLYSSPPFRLKKIPILNSFLIAVAALVMILNGFFWSAPAAKLTQFPAEILVLVLVAGTLGINFTHIKDTKGDEKTGTKTLLTIFGEKRGKLIVGVLFFGACLAAPLFLKKLTLLIPAGVFGTSGFFLIVKEKFHERWLFLVYFLYIFSILMFYWAEHLWR